jgi:hypothetical protein
MINRESNIGKPGVWIYLIGDRRRYGRFRITSAGNEDDIEEVFAPVQRKYDRLFYIKQYKRSFSMKTF